MKHFPKIHFYFGDCINTFNKNINNNWEWSFWWWNNTSLNALNYVTVATNSIQNSTLQQYWTNVWENRKQIFKWMVDPWKLDFQCSILNAKILQGAFPVISASRHFFVKKICNIWLNMCWRSCIMTFLFVRTYYFCSINRFIQCINSRW